MALGYLGHLVSLFCCPSMYMGWVISPSVSPLSICKFSLSHIMPVKYKLDWDTFPGKEVQILFLFFVNVSQLLQNTVLKSDTCWRAPHAELGWGAHTEGFLVCMPLGQDKAQRRKDEQDKARGKTWEFGKVIFGRDFELFAPSPSSLLTSALKAACDITAFIETWNNQHWRGP